MTMTLHDLQPETVPINLIGNESAQWLERTGDKKQETINQAAEMCKIA